MKVIIFDSGPLINLSMNGLLHLLEKLKENFDGKFIITNPVKNEVYDHPLKIKRFQLGALQILELINKKILEDPESIGISKAEIEKETSKMMSIINSSFTAGNNYIKIVSEAETSCLALSSILNKKKIDNLIAIDERTARLISEKPENLISLMSKKLHKRVSSVNSNIRDFEKLRFIRSPELVYVAYKKGLTNLKGKKALEALLYATKYKGSSVSFEEIEELKNL